MTAPLPIRSNLYVLESPASYASRLAIMNGLPGAHQFCVDQDLDMQGVADGDPWMIKRLAQLGGISSSLLFRWSVKKLKGKQYHVANQLLEQRWIVRSALRLCPCCVAEAIDPENEGIVGKATWHISFMRQCPTHGVLLRAYERIGYGGSVHDFTKRCLELRWQIETAAENGRPKELSKLAVYIEARAMGSFKSSWLDTLELNAAAYFCELLGLLADRGAAAGISSLSGEQRNTVGSIGYEIASGGPEGVLNVLRSLPRPRPKSKAQAHLGNLYQWLSRSGNHKQYDPIKKLVHDYIAETFPVGPGEVVLGTTIEQRRVHSLATFSRECKASSKRAEEALVAAGVMQATGGQSIAQERTVFCARSSEPVMEKLNDGITRRMAIKLLNIPRAQFDALLVGGILKPMPGLGEITPYYARTDVLTLLGNLTRERRAPNCPTDLFDIQTACRKLVCGAAEIVELIASGQLQTVAQDGTQTGYLAVRVSVSELATKLKGVGVEGFTKAEVKRLLSINDPAVKFLVEAGHLKTTAARNPVTRKAAAVVLPEDMDRFLQVFAPAKFVAKDLGTTSRAVIAQMRKRGVEPLEMPDGCVGTVYERQRMTMLA